MKFRDVYILAASIGVMTLACGGEQFSSAPQRAALGGLSEVTTGDQPGSGGRAFASGSSAGGDAGGNVDGSAGGGNVTDAGGASSSDTRAQGGSVSLGGSLNTSVTGAQGGSVSLGGSLNTSDTLRTSGGSHSGGSSSFAQASAVQHSGGKVHTGGAWGTGGLAVTGGSSSMLGTGGAVEPITGGTATAGGATPNDGGSESTGGRSESLQTGGTSQSAGMGSTGGTEPKSSTSTIPSGWTCTAMHFGTDDGCDCGCGVLDPDCDGKASVEACVSANDAGSCGNVAAWSLEAIDRNDNTRCSVVPAGWTCAPMLFGDGVCHCGCGITDSDCQDSHASSCQICEVAGSCSRSDYDSTCEGLEPDSNSKCVRLDEKLAGWTCAPQLFGSGDGCDCGCGIVDPDCAGMLSAQCEWCDDEGSCSHSGGCAVINPDNSAVCIVGKWRCDPARYGGGDGCDCGCGEVDPDCRSSSADACAYCASQGSCAHNCADIVPNSNAYCTVAR